MRETARPLAHRTALACRRFCLDLSLSMIAREAAKQNYRFSSVVFGIVKSTPFMMKKAPGADSPRLTASHVGNRGFPIHDSRFTIDY